MKTLYNFFRPTASSSSHALAASLGAKEITKDVGNIASNVSALGVNGLKAGATVIGGIALFEYLSGKLMLTYVGSATINAFGKSAVGTLVKQLSGKAIEAILKYPVGSLAATILTNLAIHPQDVIKLMNNSYNIVTNSVKTIIDSVKVSYEVYQTMYTKVWEQFEPSIKNLKSNELLEATKVDSESDGIEMKTFKVNDETEEKVEETNVVQETKANSSSWFSSAYNTFSSISAKVSSLFTSEPENSTAQVEKLKVENSTETVDSEVENSTVPVDTEVENLTELTDELTDPLGDLTVTLEQPEVKNSDVPAKHTEVKNSTLEENLFDNSTVTIESEVEEYEVNNFINKSDLFAASEFNVDLNGDQHQESYQN